MKDQHTCESAEIARFLESDDYRVEDSAFIEHLDSCESCQVRLEKHAADGATWERLIGIIRPQEFDEAGTAEFSAANCLR